MTQIASYIPALPQPEDPGIHSLDHFGLVVPDLAKAEHFYKSFGIDVHRESQTIALCTGGQPHQWAKLAEGERKRLQYLSFGAFEEDFARFLKKLDQFQVRRADPPSFVPDSRGLWFRDPEGTLLQIKVCEKTSPAKKEELGTVSSPPNVRGAISTSEVRVIRPRRLAHVLFLPAMSTGQSSSTAMSSACACPIARTITSRSCMEFTAAIIT
jgi:catechol 2,3-dioxygenase-like lactoylglutathione lyase family enzyme